jgi:hypothetical protein
MFSASPRIAALSGLEAMDVAALSANEKARPK